MLGNRNHWGATWLRTGNRLIILTDKGELVMALANPDRFQPKSRAQVLSSEVRAFPALADGFLFARSKDRNSSVSTCAGKLNNDAIRSPNQ